MAYVSPIRSRWSVRTAAGGIALCCLVSGHPPVRAWAGLIPLAAATGCSARLSALGNTRIIADDAGTAVAGNPAGLGAPVGAPSVVCSYAHLLGDVRLGTLGAVFGAPSRWALAAVYHTASADGIEARDESGAVHGTFAVTEHAFTFAGSGRIAPRITCGIAAHAAATTVAGSGVIQGNVDIGLRAAVSRQTMVGVSITNIGAETFSQGSGSAPGGTVQYHVGAAALLGQPSMLLVLQGSVAGGESALRAGLEWRPVPFATVRIGSDAGTPTAGGGLEIGTLSFDYAAAFVPDIGVRHHTTLSYRFGGGTGYRGTGVFTATGVSPLVVSSWTAMPIIPLAFVHLFPDRGVCAVRGTLTNDAPSPTTLIVRSRYGISTMYDQRTVTVPAHRSVTVCLTPPLTPHAARTIQHTPTPATISVEVFAADDTGTAALLDAATLPSSFYAADAFVPVVQDAAGARHLFVDALAAWVTPGHPALAAVVGRAAARGRTSVPPVSFTGAYARAADDPGFTDDGAHERAVVDQVRLLYETVRDDYGLLYVNQPVVFRDAQRIKFPAQTLHAHGNCIELAVLFAALLESIEIDPLLVILPDEEHALFGWRYRDVRGARYWFFDTALFGRDFWTCVDAGNSRLRRYGIDPQSMPDRGSTNDKGYVPIGDHVILLDIRASRNATPPTPYQRTE